MDEPAQLRENRTWRIAVWALRVGYLALVVVVVGIVVNAAGGTPAVLGVGLALWIVAAVASAGCFTRARNELPEPKPGFVEVRSMLLRASVGRDQ